ncbi:DUF2695 domain-containing protein [Flavobacterium sp.]|uniref:DUF2695 domain-containing protein n=1 Tax=Flavobacterium sp. TaxID=239 RepID=UPI00261B3805|nr:DUF2695 domain-containing protein [Flavobacterium sp.]
MILLTEQQANDLITFVEDKLTTKSCNHKLTFAMQWAKKNKIDLEDFEDLMLEQGCGCDCEVVLNLPDEGDLELEEEKEKNEDNINPFKIPAIFVEDLSKLYDKALFTSDDLDYNIHTSPNEILIPAPYGYKPKKKMPRGDWFFISSISEMPNGLGFVKQIEPISAIEFSKKIRNSNIECLKDFSPRAASYYFSRIELQQIGNGMWCHFLERTGIGGFSADLKINKAVR